MSTKDSIYKQHEENTEWLNKLRFYKDEIKILTGRLEEIAMKNSSVEVLADVEHFQNQFIIQRNNIDNIAHEVEMSEKTLIEEIKHNPTAVDHRKVDYHKKEFVLIESFEHNFKDIREEFMRFTARWM
jgi:hypothetical protein